ncbi:toxin YdaT family protein [Yokenella regensburgei]|uniref:toxin YdaT family protein n=1 Tax=Yokenella regensburgei TaxID=158877 RepID=UPI003ED8F39C
MAIRHELIREVVLTLAVQDSQESVSTDIANKYHYLGGGPLALYRIDDPVGQSDLVRRNRLNLFRPHDGWLQGRTVDQRRKTQELLPAILAVLPDNLAARLLVGNSIEYRALVAAEESIRTAKHAYMQTRRELFAREYHSARRGSEGPTDGMLVH